MKRRKLKQNSRRYRTNLMDFQKRIVKMLLKHAGAQSASEVPMVNTDKEKIKLLLGERWMCFDSITAKINKYILPSIPDDCETPQKKVSECYIGNRVMQNPGRLLKYSNQLKASAKQISLMMSSDWRGESVF